MAAGEGVHLSAPMAAGERVHLSAPCLGFGVKPTLGKSGLLPDLRFAQSSS